ncbi:S-layer protein [uncultured archaeon]|nr:S-layer protein [uncultured archaeon]
MDSVFAGATTDMVQLRYTWLMSEDVTKIQGSDTYGVFKNANPNSNSKTITMNNTDSSVSLSRDSTVNLMGELNFVTADSSTLRFYPAVDYVIPSGTGTGTGTGTPGVGTPVVTTPGTSPNATTPVTTTVGGETPTTTVTTPATTTAAPKKTEPGFEAVFAIAGLLAVAFLVLRQRK